MAKNPSLTKDPNKPVRFHTNGLDQAVLNYLREQDPEVIRKLEMASVENRAAEIQLQKRIDKKSAEILDQAMVMVNVQGLSPEEALLLATRYTLEPDQE